MEAVVHHLNDNWKVYATLFTALSFAVLFWLSKYFATRKELDAHKLEFSRHIVEFKEHQIDHRRLRDLVQTINGKLENLPTAKDSFDLRESIAHLNGRLEGMEPLFKQLLNNDNILFENELRGEKK